MNTFQANSATCKTQEVRKWLDPAVPYSITSPWACPAHCQGSWAAAAGTGSCPGTSWGQDQSTWTPLLPYRAAGAARRNRAWAQVQCMSVGSSQDGTVQMERTFYQEQSSQQATGQSELSPLTRPRWQNTQLRGGKNPSKTLLYV